MSNWLTITKKRTTNYKVNVADFLDSQELNVKFTLIGLYNNGTNTPTTFGSSFIMNKISGAVGNQYMYVCQIGNENFPQADTYFGKIEATNPNVGNQIVYTQKVLINIVEPELTSKSNVTIGSEPLTYGELIEFITNKNLAYPFPVSRNPDGSETFTLYSEAQFPLVLTDANKRPLPLGAYIKVFSKDKYTKKGLPMNVPVFNQLAPILLWTNEDGTPKGFSDIEPITNGTASYTYIGGLPKGEYFLNVYVGNKIIKTQSFSFPQQCYKQLSI